MRAPRLLEVQCPRCGAGLRIPPRAQVVTCTYCEATSVVHMPDERGAAPRGIGPDGRGHIHVSPDAVKALGTFVVLSVVGPLVATLVGVVVVVVVVVVIVLTSAFRATTSTAPRPGVVPSPAVVVTSSPSAPGMPCFKAAACCKALLAVHAKDPQAVAACDGLLMLHGAECDKQYAGLAKSAAAARVRCE
jgi:hypothetical protein